MKTNYLNKLYNRSLLILELIDDCDRRQLNAKHYLNRYNDNNYIIGGIYNFKELENNVNRYDAIRERLTAWLFDINAKINKVFYDYKNKKAFNDIIKDIS